MAASPPVSRSTRLRNAANPSTRHRPGSGNAVHCTSNSPRSAGFARNNSREASATPSAPFNEDDTAHARHSGSDPGTCRYTPLTVTGSTPLARTNGTVPPAETPTCRATDSDSATCPTPAGQAPCVNSANRCGSATANGVTDNPVDAPAPAPAPDVGNVNGIDVCSTSSTCAVVPGNARRNAARTWASAFSSAPSAYRPDTESDSRGSPANRCRIPSVTELPVNAVSAANTATANNTVTAAAPSTTPCCPARRTPTGDPRPAVPMSPPQPFRRHPVVWTNPDDGQSAAYPPVKQPPHDHGPDSFDHPPPGRPPLREREKAP
ncbi:hypothetical protein OU787_23460 [Kitasatospora sp. YST-16]|uniref:hypothetical protein n=1 Tax=Kitasatospora sp. YST-16 TaxID=2998080 RepID=UPI002283ED67|nr:hypothetical protein [Kitasatospora sp. YST-16]WAL74190.1 hypothetical protein OU787_23460 [Kitasatospora sp. YST-16]WNW40257.1 hypothetical protein RKE32_23410 [Streptomyces sp. Li-HN-5-13]